MLRARKAKGILNEQKLKPGIIAAIAEAGGKEHLLPLAEETDRRSKDTIVQSGGEINLFTYERPMPSK